MLRTRSFEDSQVIFQDIPQDISDEITAVVGGCRLLCQDKLGKQFRNLCLKAKGELPLKKDEVAPPTEEDLVGFWELVNIQVDHMKEKCENIKKLKENQWQVNSSLDSLTLVGIEAILLSI